LGDGFGRRQTEQGLDLLAPRLEARWSEPMAEPVGFLDGPFALKGVDGEAVVLEAREDRVKRREMRFDLLGDVRGDLDTHWQAAGAVLAERGDDGAEVAGFLVELERVELH
jgi:hypothetical protein